MAYTIAFPTSAWLRETSAAWLGQNARLSMMEIYFVQLFIMIFARQEHVLFMGVTLRIDLSVRAGVLLFHLGIFLSMIVGEILEQMEYVRAGKTLTFAKEDHARSCTQQNWRKCASRAHLALLFD